MKQHIKEKALSVSFLFILFFTSCSMHSIEKSMPENIYDPPALNHQMSVSLWKSVFPYLLEYCREDSSSPVIISNRRVGKFFSSENSQLQHINFGIGRIRYSLIRAMSDLSGFTFAIDKTTDSTIRFVLMHNSRDMAVLEKAFKRLFGIALISGKIYNTTRRIVPDPPAAYSKIKDVCFYAYNPEAIERSFLALYCKPDSELFGHKAQIVYDAVFKNYFRELSLITAILLSDTSFITDRSKEYLQQYQDNPDFHSVAYAQSCTKYILTKQKNNRLLEKFYKLYPSPYYAYHLKLFSERIMGILLRRKADNSLAAVLKILRTILHDYDPETYNELKNFLYI